MLTTPVMPPNITADFLHYPKLRHQYRTSYAQQEMHGIRGSDAIFDMEVISPDQKPGDHNDAELGEN